MIFPAATALFSALFALLFLGLSGWVIAGRVAGNVLIGDDGREALQRRIRAHANFAEYVPLTLGLIALLEAGGSRPWIVITLLTVLLVARLLHPIGMLAPAGTPRQFACRGGGIIATLSVTGVAAMLLLVRAL